VVTDSVDMVAVRARGVHAARLIAPPHSARGVLRPFLSPTGRA
jgi:hypothetical protein